MRILFGYFFIALSVVILLALVSFHPNDSALFVSNVNIPPENIAGSIGVWLSAPLVLLYGKFAAHLLNFGIFTIGINILIGSKLGRTLIKGLLFVISTISLSVILSLAIKNATFIEGGLLGISIGKSLSEIIHPYITIGLFGLVLLLSLSTTMKLFQRLAFAIARIFGTFVLAPFELLGMVIRDRNQEGTENQPAAVFSEKTDRPVMEEDNKNSAGTIPDFLQPPSNDNDKEETSTFLSEFPSKSAEDAPDWLTDERKKLLILNNIKGIFDREIDPESVPVEPAVMEEALEAPVPAKIPEAENIPELHEEETIIPEFIETEAESEETVEIAGEADYASEAVELQKKREDTDANEALFKEALEENAGYIFPDANSLEKGFEEFSRNEENQEVENVSRVIESTFASFKIDVRVSGHSRGPAITRYEIEPPSGLKLKNIVNLTDDLALNLGTRNIRIVAPIGNRSIIGVEVPNKNRKSVVLRDIIESPEYKKSKAKLPLILGKDIAGNIVIEDLTEMPHLLIAGTTGSGKSVYVNSLIGGLVFARSSNEVKFIFIDPKMVELELYNGIPHLLAPVITSPEEAIGVLEWASAEMDRRYKILSEFGVRNIVDYNKEIKKITKSKKKADISTELFPYIVVVIDEFANLMLRLPKETEKVISRIAAMARAVGIHLVVATQRPSVDVITGIIKANFPSRITFRVSSQTDSRTILDKNGAEKLLGRGDMLFMTPNFTDMLRIQSPYVSNQDVESLVRELKRNGTADYQIDLENLNPAPVENGDSEYAADYRQDPIFADSLKAAVENGEISASYLQRRFRIGYNRASRIIEAMERLKILAPATGTSKPREVLIRQEDLVNYI